MKVRGIYKKYKIIPNLQEHMLRVTKVVLFIIDHWQGRKIDKELIKKAALMHDLGNIVKFDFEKNRELTGNENRKIDYWLGVQKEMIDKYDFDDHQATIKILKKLKVDPSLLSLISSKGFDDAIELKKSNNWELKILVYADLRTGPFGVVSLKERLNEVEKRRNMREELPDFDELEKACYQIEKQIQENLDIGVSKITDELIERDDTELLNTEI